MAKRKAAELEGHGNDAKFAVTSSTEMEFITNFLKRVKNSPVEMASTIINEASKDKAYQAITNRF
jgi:hypothetical protein